MKTSAARRILAAALLAGISPAAAHAAGEIKGGKWQFTTQMQLPAQPQSAPGAQPPAAGSQPMTRTVCIDPTHPVPAEGQCKPYNVKRDGGRISWAMTCNSPQGPVRSTGSGRYAGDTMEATLTARVPGPNGSLVDAPGRITGRYLGACDRN